MPVKDKLDSIAKSIPEKTVKKMYRMCYDSMPEDLQKLSQIWIGLLSNRTETQVSIEYLKLHLYDHEDLIKRMTSIDPSILSQNILKGHIKSIDEV